MSLFKYTVRGKNKDGKDVYVQRTIGSNDIQSIVDALSKSYSSATVVIYVECVQLSDDDQEVLNIGVDL